MFNITVLAMGKLKEKFYIQAVEEYAKRLGGYCRFQLLEMPEFRLPEDPSPAQIAEGLAREAQAIREKIPKGSWFCVLTPEGRRFPPSNLPGRWLRSSYRGVPPPASCWVPPSVSRRRSRLWRISASPSPP